MSRLVIAGLVALGFGALPAVSADQPRDPAAPLLPVRPGKPVAITWQVDSEPLALRSEPWFAGAISSLRFRGVEYLDRADHGRLMQGAISFRRAQECLNPTEAGASRDGPHATTSRRLSAFVSAARLYTRTRMAYWLRPGQSCALFGGAQRPVLNASRLSDVVYSQDMRPGFHGQAHAVLDQIAFETGTDETDAVVEAWTAYLPAGFSAFRRFDPATGRSTPDPVPPGGSRPETPQPVIASTADGRSALAVLALSGEPAPNYGVAATADIAKINLVYRPQGLYPAGRHEYACVWIIGSLAEVEAALRALAPPPRD